MWLESCGLFGFLRNHVLLRVEVRTHLFQWIVIFLSCRAWQPLAGLTQKAVAFSWLAEVWHSTGTPAAPHHYILCTMVKLWVVWDLQWGGWGQSFSPGGSPSETSCQCPCRQRVQRDSLRVLVLVRVLSVPQRAGSRCPQYWQEIVRKELGLWDGVLFSRVYLVWGSLAVTCFWFKSIVVLLRCHIAVVDLSFLFVLFKWECCWVHLQRPAKKPNIVSGSHRKAYQMLYRWGLGSCCMLNSPVHSE